MARKLLACLGIAALLATAGCGEDSAKANGLSIPTGAKLAGDFGGSGPGTLITANTLTRLNTELRDASGIAARITYTSGTNNGTWPVTGAVFVPRGEPASPDGWPIVAFGHPTTGIQPECAPSLSRTLLGLQDTIIGLLKAGVLVTVPDYQGLGAEGAHHPYLDATAVGVNLIDSVRAARKLVRSASDRWIALGVEQGGQAAWAANELAREYGGGLHMLGSISIAPFTDLQGLAEAAPAGSLTNEQKLVLQTYLAAQKAQNQDFDLDAFRRGTVQTKWDELSACGGPQATERQKVAEQITSDDLRPASPEAVATLHDLLRKSSLPQTAATAPMWIVYGNHDPLIPVSWMEKSLKAACGLGDVIQIEVYKDGPPRDIDVGRVVSWFRGRLLGDAAVNDCSKFAPAPPEEEPTSEDEEEEEPS